MPTKEVENFGQRRPLEAVRADLAVLVPATAKDTFKLKRGGVIGVITASKLIRRRTRTLAAGAGFATNTAVGRVDDASVFAAGDVLTNAAGATVGTVQSIDTTTTPDTVTLTGNAAVAVAAGAAVLGSDGSQVAKGVSDNETDGVGDTTVSVYIGGYFDKAKLIDMDASAMTELGAIESVGGIIKF